MPTSALLLMQTVTSTTNLWLDYTKTLVVLAGICLVALFSVKFLLPKITGVAASAPSDHIRVFARQPLEPRKMLYLVKAGKSVVLLASAGDTVQFMTTLDAQDFALEEAPAAAVSQSSFRRITQAIAERNGGKSR